jgi:hypothetical protein
LVASDAAGDPVGMVAVSTFDPGVATVTFLGVLPEHRGHGYGHDLLQAATSAAHGRGFEEMLSDVDTLNQPMIDIMRNAGHLGGVRPWHIWHYRAEVATLVAVDPDGDVAGCPRRWPWRPPGSKGIAHDVINGSRRGNAFYCSVLSG